MELRHEALFVETLVTQVSLTICLILCLLLWEGNVTNCVADVVYIVQ